jgi:hypothetical protein
MAFATDDLLTVEEAAEVLGVSVQRMYNLRNLGEGPVSYRRGRRLMYPRNGLVAFLAHELRATVKGEGALRSGATERPQTMRRGQDALASARAAQSRSGMDRGLTEPV